MKRFPHGATLRPPFVRPGAGYGRRGGRPGPESARPKLVVQHPAGRHAVRNPADRDDERGASVT
jgi:hypothetical protein